MPSLAWPLALLLLALPWLAGRWRPRQGALPALRMPGRPLVRRGERFPGFAAGRWPNRLAAIIWLCLVVALARPLWPEEVPVAAEAPPGLLLVLDISASMGAEDLLLHGKPVSRLAVAKEIAGELIRSLDTYRAGLIVFGSAAHVHTPVTRDKAALLEGLAALPGGLAGRGSELDQALALAASLRSAQHDDKSMLIVLSDGDARPGSLAAEDGPTGGTRIHALLVAGARAAANARSDEGGRGGGLQALAARSGGSFARVADGEALRKFLETIRQTEREAVNQQTAILWRELYPWPLALALVLSAGLGLHLSRRGG